MQITSATAKRRTQQRVRRYTKGARATAARFAQRLAASLATWTAVFGLNLDAHADAGTLQSGLTLCYLDRDGDNFGDFLTEAAFPWSGTALRCQDLPANDAGHYWISNGLDCDDDVNRCGAACRPGLAEICDGWDNDCSAATPDGANDNRIGFSCDSPGDANLCQDDLTGCVAGQIACVNRPDGDDLRVEVCDADRRDEDCDGFADDLDPDGPPPNARRWYRDADGDGFGTASQSLLRCLRPEGYSPVAGDCDDDPTRCGAACAPGLLELCDARDNDCNPQTPDGSADAAVGSPCDSPFDSNECNDDFLVCSASGLVCENDPFGDEQRVERCDIFGIDEDCNGGANDNDPNGPPPDAFTWYRDADGDGFGRTDFFLRACVRPEGYVPVGGDCDDDPDACGMLCSPIVVESRGAGNCEDGHDNDCDGLRDAGDACRAATICYADADGDGYGDPATERTLPFEFKGECRRYTDAETAIETLVDNGLDCDDNDPDISPEATDIVGSDRDENCDGMLTCLYDADGDGLAGDSLATINVPWTPGVKDCSNSPNATLERGDCDDDPDRCGAACFPGGEEICDGWDNNCDRRVDEDAVCAAPPPVIIDGSGGCAGGDGLPAAAAMSLLFIALAVLRRRTAR